MNHIVISGNLVDKVRVANTADGKINAFGKIGVYNGKTRDGQQRESMFFDIVLFGRNAETLRDLGNKGTPVIVSGRLEEDKSVSQTNGQTYVNKRIICDDANVLVKPVSTQPYQPTVQPVPTQPMAQQPYQAPQYNYNTPAPYAQQDPFGV
jgi:single-stranded DNA-binding protein